MWCFHILLVFRSISICTPDVVLENNLKSCLETKKSSLQPFPACFRSTARRRKNFSANSSKLKTQINFPICVLAKFCICNIFNLQFGLKKSFLIKWHFGAKEWTPFLVVSRFLRCLRMENEDFYWELVEDMHVMTAVKNNECPAKHDKCYRIKLLSTFNIINGLRLWFIP